MSVENLTATQQTEIDAIIARAAEGFEAVELEAARCRIDVAGNPVLAFALIKSFRQNRRPADARRLILDLVQRHSEDAEVLGECVVLLHRVKAFADVVEVLALAQQRGLFESTPALQVIEADSLLNLGKVRQARRLALGVPQRQTGGVTRQILERVLETTESSGTSDPEIAAIEAAFDKGEYLKGATLFRAMLQGCRDKAALGAGSSIRDADSQSYSNAFQSVRGEARDGDKVLLVADSIAMPRIATNVGPAQTYPFLVDEALDQATEGRVSLILDCRRGRTVVDVCDAIADAPGNLAGVVIQVGIVDCAPRVFSVVDVHAVRKVKGEEAAEAVIDIASRHRTHLQGARETSPYVSRVEFEEKLANAVRVAKLKSDTVLIMNIVTPSSRGSKMSSTALAKNIVDYNESIIRVVRDEKAVLVDVDGHIWSQADALECFTSDNYHYNQRGHMHCSDILASILLQNLPAR